MKGEKMNPAGQGKAGKDDSPYASPQLPIK